MADFLSAITPNTDLTVSDVDGLGPGTSTSLDTGDLRRKYNFGDRVSEVSIAQDPFFSFLSKVAKKPVDDPQFKWAEKRPSWHKRYAYCIGHYVSGTLDVHDSEIDVATGGAATAAGDTIELAYATDYASAGNIQNVFGSSQAGLTIGATGTRPTFFLEGQLIKIPTGTVNTAAGSTATSYHVARINSVASDDTSAGGVDNDTMELQKVNCTIVKFGGSNELAGFFNNNGFSTNASGGSNETYSESIAGTLEQWRSYVVGTAFTEGSGYPETWKDQPYSTNIGLTQIWKTSMAMTNTARATSLKYDANEWARIWKEKLIEHKWDLETSLLFGSQATVDDIQYTQGALDYISTYGNAFSLSIATKTADDFLDDMSNYLDPRYNPANATIFFCNTAVYNWLHKLGGYFKNNLEISSNFRSDLAMTGKKKVFGVDISTFSTPYGDMNVARNIHLDGAAVKMVGINMKNCAWRPLVGNGINRDTSVYVGVQTLENSGVDRRVDLILTEGGMEWQLAESHAIWT